MTDSIAIHWFRQDLRLSDNPALTKASKHKNVMPIYILDDCNCGEFGLGAASKWWLYHSLNELNASLNYTLSIYRGNPIDILMDTVTRHDVKAVYWNRCYEPWRMQRDTKIKDHLKGNDIEVESYNGSLLWEPWTIKKNDGSPYKVFTPFYRKGCLGAKPPQVPLDSPTNMEWRHDNLKSIKLNQLDLLPEKKWVKQLKTHWKIGEQGALLRLNKFIDEGLGKYKTKRNFPDKPHVSRLSPHLHFGEISPNQLWYALYGLANNKNVDHFLSELGWREFSYSQLYQNPDLPRKNLQPKFDLFPWVDNEAMLMAWKKGETGVPMIDAGMRELWQTGYMHNRVRMIVGSFLVKNLKIHWHYGERWFWDTLVDADLANNSASWQWVAGCGADAAPYFRIFNPVTQGQKFDPEGNYVRRYVNEIATLPNEYLFNPWDAPQHILKEANIELGSTYPKPIVDLKTSRNTALEAFQALTKKEPSKQIADETK
jgi:deoxyribodipyrimidine photo-lyase